MHREGTLLARYPHVETLIGENFKKGSPQQIEVFNAQQFSGALQSPIDGKDRLIASQMLSTVPLVIVATATEDAALGIWRSQTRFFISMAILSLLVTALVLYLIFRQITRQHQVSRQLLTVRRKQQLDTAISNMSQGLLLFDSSERLIVCNRRYIDIYGLSQDIAKPGCSLRDLLHHRKITGSLPGDIDRYRDEILRGTGKSTTVIVETADGRLIQIKSEPVPDGGWLATHEDVTERVRAEKRIAHFSTF